LNQLQERVVVVDPPDYFEIGDLRQEEIIKAVFATCN
jgi:hypothetical protein